MITGAALATVYYNIKLRHPFLDLPIIDYDLALLFQPMLVLGISIGVIFNVIFAEWMVTVLLIVLFIGNWYFPTVNTSLFNKCCLFWCLLIGTSTKAFFKGVETWKKETIIKKVVWIFLLFQSRISFFGDDEVLHLILLLSSFHIQEAAKRYGLDGEYTSCHFLKEKWAGS